MTISPSNSAGHACPDHHRPGRAAPTRMGRSIELRWTATAAPFADANGDGLPHCVALVVSLQPVDDRHAILEAWLENPEGSRPVTSRRLVSCSRQLDGDLVHIDASLDGARVVWATLGSPESGRGGMPLYARTTLLASAGFAPGAYDPPTARFLTPKSDAASA